jgi:hypothetical protein
VQGLAVGTNSIFLGGDFTALGGVARNALAALDATTGMATSWDPNRSKSFAAVEAIAVNSGTVYAVGGQASAFSTSSGDALWDMTPSGVTYALALGGGNAYVGGDFTHIAGLARNHVAEIDPTGTVTAWNPSPNASVRALAVSGGTVYAGGLFASVGGQTRNHLAAIDAATGAPTAWNPGPDDGVDAIVLSGGTVYVGGGFTHVAGLARNDVAALDVVTGSASPWNPSADSLVRAILPQTTGITVGGWFFNIGGMAKSGVAVLDPTTGRATAWRADVTPQGASVDAVADCGTGTCIGGGFTDIAASGRAFFAIVDATGRVL